MVLILVSGVPASGKSTMAAYLSNVLSMPMVSKDGVKELLYDTIGFESREQKVKLGDAAMAVMYDMARACLNCGQSVILENNFEHVSRKGLERLTAAYGCPVLTVQMTGDLHALYDRFVQRNQSAERHLGHVVNDRYPPLSGSRTRVEPPAYEAFAESMKKRGMDVPPMQGDCLAVDTTDLTRVDMAAVAGEVKAWMRRHGESVK